MPLERAAVPCRLNRRVERIPIRPWRCQYLPHDLYNRRRCPLYSRSYIASFVKSERLKTRSDNLSAWKNSRDTIGSVALPTNSHYNRRSAMSSIGELGSFGGHHTKTSRPKMQHKWWKESTVYQMYPASFKDSNGDGVGDIPGIISELDYVKSLGVDIVWLSPILKSPQVDMGYDISDYKDIHPPYGTMADHDALIKGVHSICLIHRSNTDLSRSTRQRSQVCLGSRG